MYKEFCEENGYVAPYVEIGDDFAFRVVDVKKADAGNAFVPESEMYRTITLDGKILKEVINAWVIPWYNINAHTYK
ncbi:MAG: hypothetical protein LUC37_06780, partial [Prevotella sp.]|nr:hypothetical protein [Prevotella sp.]